MAERNTQQGNQGGRTDTDVGTQRNVDPQSPEELERSQQGKPAQQGQGRESQTAPVTGTETGTTGATTTERQDTTGTGTTNR